MTIANFCQRKKIMVPLEKERNYSLGKKKKKERRKREEKKRWKYVQNNKKCVFGFD
jgi:hypothetical protein